MAIITFTRELINIENISELKRINSSNLVITSQSFGLLRKGVFKHMGKEKAKGFLLHFGKELGSNKAKEVMKDIQSIEELTIMAPQIHIELGHVSSVEYNTPPKDLKNCLKEMFSNITGKWIDSFEVNLHLEHHGIADECSCYTLSGFASGFLSTKSFK